MATYLRFFQNIREYLLGALADNKDENADTYRLWELGDLPACTNGGNKPFI